MTREEARTLQVHSEVFYQEKGGTKTPGKVTRIVGDGLYILWKYHAYESWWSFESTYSNWEDVHFLQAPILWAGWEGST